MTGTRPEKELPEAGSVHDLFEEQVRRTPDAVAVAHVLEEVLLSPALETCGKATSMSRRSHRLVITCGLMAVVAQARDLP